MTRDGRLGALLPWFLNGTLSEPEKRAFEQYLATSKRCQEEMKVVRKLQRQMQEHGDAFFEDHPSAEELVAYAAGEIKGQRAEEIAHHLTLCRTCALEYRWILGEARAGREPGERIQFPRRELQPAETPVRTGASWWLVAAALVAGVALTFLFNPPSDSQRIDLGLGLPILTGTERSDEADVVRPDTAAGVAPFLLSVDAGTSAYPLTVEVEGESGLVHPFERSIGDMGELIQGQFVLVPAPLETCSPGETCTVRVRAADGSVAVERAFPVEPLDD